MAKRKTPSRRIYSRKKTAITKENFRELFAPYTKIYDAEFIIGEAERLATDLIAISQKNSWQRKYGDEIETIHDCRDVIFYVGVARQTDDLQASMAAMFHIGRLFERVSVIRGIEAPAADGVHTRRVLEAQADANKTSADETTRIISTAYLKVCEKNPDADKTTLVNKTHSKLKAEGTPVGKSTIWRHLRKAGFSKKN